MQTQPSQVEAGPSNLRPACILKRSGAPFNPNPSPQGTHPNSIIASAKYRSAFAFNTGHRDYRLPQIALTPMRRIKQTKRRAYPCLSASYDSCTYRDLESTSSLMFTLFPSSLTQAPRMGRRASNPRSSSSSSSSLYRLQSLSRVLPQHPAKENEECGRRCSSTFPASYSYLSLLVPYVSRDYNGNRMGEALRRTCSRFECL